MNVEQVIEELFADRESNDEDFESENSESDGSNEICQNKCQ